MNIETERTPHPSKKEIRALIAVNRADYDERLAPKKRARQERYLRAKQGNNQ